MSTLISPDMSLPIPAVGNEPGPNYASDVNACFTIIDSHNHSPGSGVQITPAGLNISSDLSFLGNSVTAAKSVQFSIQASLAITSALYLKNGSESPNPIADLWFNDGNGTAIQITSNGALAATASAIPGESYSAGTFSWKQGTGSTTPAYFDIASITLRPATPATTYGVTLQPDPAIASAYTLTLPADPSSLTGTSFLQMNSGGVIAAGPHILGALTTANLSASAGIVGGQLSATAGILGSQLSASANITGSQLSASAGILGSQLSASAGIVGGQLDANINLPAGTKFNSKFIVANTDVNLKIIRGAFDAWTGGILYGEGFTISNLGGLVFRVTFTSAFSSAPSVTLAYFDNSASGYSAILAAMPVAGHSDIVSSGGAPGLDVCFIAVGPV